MKKTRKVLLALLTAGLIATTACGIAACDDAASNEDQGGNTEVTQPTTPEEATVYTVKFETNGGTLLPEQGANPGDKAVKPGDPKKAGYTFGGWYANSACTTEYDFNKAVNADTTIYAKWNAAPTTDAGYFRLTQDGEGWSVAAMPGKIMPVDVVIPSEIDGKTITSVAVSGFEDVGNIQSVTLPDTVTSIGQRAFRGCTDLEVVIGGANVEMIDSDAFDNTMWDNNLPAGEVYLGKTLYKYASSIFVETEIEVKAGTVGVASGAFLNQPNLVGVTFPEGLKYIGSYAFGADAEANGNALTEVVLPDSVVEVGAGAFRYAPIETLVIGKSVEYIGEKAFFGGNISYLEYNAPKGVIADATFSGMEAPATVKIADDVTEFPENLVKGWDGIVSLDFGKGITVIPAGALEGHEMLSEVKFGDLVRIGNKAFKGTSLTNVTLPATLNRLGDNAFADCSALQSVTIESAEAVVSGKTFPAFANCPSLTEVKFTSTVRKIADYLFYGSSQLRHVAFEQGVQSIGMYSFYGTSIEGKLVLPNGLLKIGDHAFDAGKDEDNLTFGVAPVASLQGVVIPASLEEIGTLAFANNLALNYVAWNAENCKTSAYTAKHDTKPAVYESAFKGCKALAYVNVGSGVDALPEQFIKGATKVEEVDIGKVPTIGANAFNGCTSLVSLGSNNGANISDLGVDALKGTPWLSNTMAAAVNKEYYIGKVLAGFSGEMPENYTLTVDSTKVVKIADAAFKGQKNLTKITLSNYGGALDSIGTSAFEGCTGLTTFSTANSKLKTIGDRAFYGCTGLTTVTLNGVVTIGNAAFNGCSNLYKDGADFTIASSIVTIGDDAFGSMVLTGKLTAASGSVLKSIGDGAFSKATPTEISLPESCERVGSTWVSGNTRTTITKYSAPGLKYAGSLPFGGSVVEEDFDFTNIVEITGTYTFLNWTREVYEFPNLTKLGAYAFAGSSLNNKGMPTAYNEHVKKVIFGAEIEELPEGAFIGTSALEEIELKHPEALKTVGKNCFVQAGNPTADRTGPIEGGTGFTIDVSHVINFGESAFGRSYYKIENLTLSEDLESLGNNAFQLCNDITGTLTIGGKIKEVPERAFMNVPFTKIVIGGDIKILGFRAFGYWSSEWRNNLLEVSPNPRMTEIVINEGVETVDPQAFVTRRGDTATLPSTLTAAGGYGTTGLGSGFNGFNFIKLNGFIEPTDMAESEPPFSKSCAFIIVNEEDRAKFEESPIWDAYKNQFVGPDGVKGGWYLNAEGKLLQYKGSKTEIVIPKEVTSFTIGQILTTQEEYAADKTFSLEQGNVNYKIDTTKKMVTSADGKTLYYYYGSDETFTDDTIETVMAYAFRYNATLKHLTLNKATTLGAAMVEGTSVEDITVPAVTEVGASAFEKLTTLTTFSAAQATKVGDSAFNGCTALATLTLPKVTEVGKSAFSSTLITKTSLDLTKLTSIGNSAFSSCKQIEGDVDISKATTLGTGVFSSCTGITSVKLNSAITTIPGSMFSNCSKLTSVTGPTKITEIGSSAFSGCSQLTSFDFTNVTTIGQQAFRTAGLTVISLPDVVTIGSYAFDNCKLTSVSIGDKCTKIDGNAFTQGNSAVTYTLTITATTPPTLGSKALAPAFKNPVAIKVPSELVETYKKASGWKDFASVISAIE